MKLIAEVMEITTQIFNHEKLFLKEFLAPRSSFEPTHLREVGFSSQNVFFLLQHKKGIIEIPIPWPEFISFYKKHVEVE